MKVYGIEHSVETEGWNGPDYTTDLLWDTEGLFLTRAGAEHRVEELQALPKATGTYRQHFEVTEIEVHGVTPEQIAAALAGVQEILQEMG